MSIKHMRPGDIMKELKKEVKMKIVEHSDAHKKKYDTLGNILQKHKEIALSGPNDLKIEQVSPKNTMSMDSIKNIQRFEDAIKIVLLRGAMREWLQPKFLRNYERYQRFFTRTDVRLNDQELQDLIQISVDLLLPLYLSTCDFTTGDLNHDISNLDRIYETLSTDFEQPKEAFIELWKDRRIKVMWQEWLYSNKTESQVPEVLEIQRLSLPDIYHKFSTTLTNMKTIVSQQRMKEKNLAKTLTKNLPIFEELLMNRGVNKVVPAVSFYDRLKDALLDW